MEERTHSIESKFESVRVHGWQKMDGGRVEERHDLGVLLEVALAQMISKSDQKFSSAWLISVNSANVLDFRFYLR